MVFLKVNDGGFGSYKSMCGEYRISQYKTPPLFKDVRYTAKTKIDRGSIKIYRNFDYDSRGVVVDYKTPKEAFIACQEHEYKKFLEKI